jgi:hypothetical protein
MFAEAFHSMIKGMHLAPKVKSSFDISAPVMSSGMKSSTQKARLPLAAVIGIAGMERRTTCIQKVSSKA